MTSPKVCVTIEYKEGNKIWVNFRRHCEDFGHGKIEVDLKFGVPIGCRPVVKDGVVQHYTKFD